ncbi:MAG: hypothetical protein II943_09020 [Victivallales bacterium]|nr:hypothetical protein [Victivallales bacterium]
MTWTIKRQGANKAAAISDGQSGEDIHSLAQAAGLPASEFGSWASEIEERFGPAGERLIKKAMVPNTVVALWAGNCGALGRWWIGWKANLRRMASRGFHVIDVSGNLTDNQFYYEIVHRQSDKTLCGVYYWDHGYGPWPSTGLCAKRMLGDSVSLLRYEDLRETLKYTLNFAYIFACDSNAGRRYLKAAEWVGFSGRLVPWWPWSTKWELR